MHITYISIFPELFHSFLQTSLIAKAIKDDNATIDIVNPRDFTHDTHRQVDDAIYGGGPGLLLKAQPIIEACNHAYAICAAHIRTKIIFLRPAKNIFVQGDAYNLCSFDHLIFVCGRYEGIDARAEQYCRQHYPMETTALSIGSFVAMGGELPAMTVTEAILRLQPGILHDHVSTVHESHSNQYGKDYIEPPQYTRPATVEGMEVPAVLRSGNHAAINQWKNKHAEQQE